MKDVEYLIKDKKLFNDFVYTPIEEVGGILRKRWENDDIEISSEIPNFMKSGFKAVISRHITTPNHETIRFINLVQQIGLEPAFWEYNGDKFTSNNKLKHALGKLIFYVGDGKAGKMFDHFTIIDFNTSNGRPISNIKTFWGQNLVEFHHEMLIAHFPDIQDKIHDASDWFFRNGDNSKKYYKSLLYPFIKHGVLFENFLLDKEEACFTEKVVIPSLLEIIKETGLKPLIVALDPTSVEEDKFWQSYELEDKKFIIGKPVL